jgi:hypothetical protein
VVSRGSFIGFDSVTGGVIFSDVPRFQFHVIIESRGIQVGLNLLPAFLRGKQFRPLDKFFGECFHG